MSLRSLLAVTVSLGVLLKGAVVAILFALLAFAGWWLLAPQCGAGCYMMHQQVAIDTAQLKMIQLYRRTGKLAHVDTQMEPPRSAHIDNAHLTSNGTVVVSSRYAHTLLIVEPLPGANGTLASRCKLWSKDLAEDLWCRNIGAGPAPAAINALPP